MKNIIITGGNSGIGLQTAKGLYVDGNNIIIGSRNIQKNETAVAQIRQAFPQSTGKIQHFALDLSKKSSIEQFSQFVKKEFKKIDILINNAGLIAFQRQTSELGLQYTYCANHFGHFYLTYLLFPLIKNSEEAKIINVSSKLHLDVKESLLADPECKDNFKSMGTYSISKLANVQFTVELASRLAKHSNIKVVSLHPGIVDTGFGDESCLFRCIKVLICCCTKSPQAGAATSLFLARSKFVSLQNGAYYDDSEVHDYNPLAKDSKSNQELWQMGQKLYGIKFQI